MTELMFGLQLFLGAVFLVASVPKLLAPRKFESAIAAYRVLPEGVARSVSLTLPGAEAAVAFWLLSGVAGQWGGIAAAALLTGFIGLAIQAMWRKLDLTCSCFGLLYKERIGPKTVGRDAVLLGLALVVVAGRQPVPLWSESGIEAGRLWWVLGVMAIAVALGYLSREQVRQAR